MSLALYSEPHEDYALSNDGTGSNAFSVTFNGLLGGIIDRRLYLRNDDSSRRYSSITVVPVDTTGINIVDGSILGFYWKLSSKDIPLTGDEWDLVEQGNTLSLSNIGSSSLGDTSTYLGFWIRISIPRGRPIEAITDVVLRVSATETLI